MSVVLLPSYVELLPTIPGDFLGETSVKLRTCVFVILVVVPGCISSYTIAPGNPADVAKLNQSLEGRQVNITLVSGAEAKGIDFRMDADSARWCDALSLDTLCVASDSLNEVDVRNPFASTVGGIIVGVPSGALVGYVAGTSIFRSRGDLANDLGVVLVSLTGAVAGGGLGGQIGYELGSDVYSFLRTTTLPTPIQTYEDFTATDIALGHVIVTIAGTHKGPPVFGILLSDTPTVRLRIPKDRVWEIPPASIVKIQRMGRHNVELSGLKSGWIVTRTDQSTFVADSLTRYENGNLEAAFGNSGVVFPIDEIKTLDQFSIESDDRSIWERGLTAGMITCGAGIILEGRSRPVGGLVFGALAVPIAGIISKVSSLVAGQTGSSFDVSQMSQKQKGAALLYLVQHEHERNATK
ncbi:MAG: hypothetical protein WBD36_07445 [Bacteroidota bacterium]